MSALPAGLAPRVVAPHAGGMSPSHVARARKVSRAALDGGLVPRQSGAGEWFDHAGARRPRAAGEKVAAITRALGMSAASVSRVCEGIVCPVDRRATA